MPEVRVESGQGLYEESSTQEGAIGALIRLNDGRTYRYSYFSAAVNRGVLCSPDISAGGVVEVDGKLTAAAIGATAVTATDSGTLGSATANQYAGAYLHTCDDAGEGFTYRIKENTAASSNAVTFTLFDPLVVAVTTATDVAITPSLYNNVKIASPTDCILCGVSVRTMQASYYGWVQTSGVATVLSDAAIALGTITTLSDGVDGAVHAQDAYTEPPVGYTTMVSDDAGHVGVILQLGID